jgi:hypothetical protein
LKYNERYRKHTRLGVQAYDDPTPMTVVGARAMVDRYHALRRLALDGRMGVGAGGPAGIVGSTTLPSLGPKKIKSLLGKNWVYDFDGPWR